MPLLALLNVQCWKPAGSNTVTHFTGMRQCGSLAGVLLTSNGFLKSHARTTHVSKLSHMPCAILASVLADSGAMTMASAQRLSSMCMIGSPTRLHSCHSSSSCTIQGWLAVGKQQQQQGWEKCCTAAASRTSTVCRSNIRFRSNSSCWLGLQCHWLWWSCGTSLWCFCLVLCCHIGTSLMPLNCSVARKPLQTKCALPQVIQAHPLHAQSTWQPWY